MSGDTHPMENPYQTMPVLNLTENISSFMLAEIKRDCWSAGAASRDAEVARLTEEVKKLGRENLSKTAAIQICTEIERKLSAQLAQAKEQGRKAVEAVLKVLDEDATGLWTVTNAIKKEIAARDWISGGRGAYEWNDDDYKQETKWAFEAVLKLIKDVQEPASNRFHNALKSGLPIEEGKDA